jgi:hypothetical protein
MTKLAFVLAVVALAVLGAVAGDPMQCLKANAQGEIVLAREAKIADITLPAELTSYCGKFMRRSRPWKRGSERRKSQSQATPR